MTELTATTRRHVISGDWSAINNGEYSLTDLGLRHNGNGLVWLHSGVSVHEADHDAGFSGLDKVSFEYHAPLRAGNKLENKIKMGFVHPQNIDDYCHNIISISPAWREFTHRKNGQPLATFAVQVNPQERKQAASGWYIWRNPDQKDKYTLLNTRQHAGLIAEHECRGWIREAPDYLTGIIRDNAEFSRLMIRLGYVQVRTRKITGRWEAFWLYRSSHRELAGNTPLRAATPAPRKASAPVVQTMTRPHPWFKRVALDSKWQYVYADHIRFLTKKRHRVDGVRVQGYTAGGLKVEVVQ
ncbi:hypothetical protein DOE63_20805 [Salmonella enterica subsp. diarizonae serovar 59:z10:-]|nr:hypothetical protein DOE63_20805 [Salmonella enterica subsp. diarizonae serovar 59:z10:-]